ncbi:MAG: hypothetical protein HFJ13_07985 [Clostridium sp.]|jgi:chromosome segregation ATPase|uniref:hypothetical protein n=1 Tax=Clostridium sp. TaxID=1506 RepID=UPI0025C1A744|nr:hypothetical protein [Clostridium sp.]MCI9069956.1 hypothetical protein [Clostridium sp.]MCI9304036.1 hypothetical protein [Clostridium sp.]
MFKKRDKESKIKNDDNLNLQMEIDYLRSFIKEQEKEIKNNKETIINLTGEIDELLKEIEELKIKNYQLRVIK